MTTFRSDVIWLVLPWSPALPAGVSVVVSRLQREFSARGLDAAIVVTDWSAPEPYQGPDGHTRFRFACFGEHTAIGLLRAVRSVPVQLWRTWRLLRRTRVAAVGFHYVGLDAIGVALLKRIGLYRGRLVLSFHGTDVRASTSAVERRLWRWLLRSADSVTCCSAALARALATVHGSAADASVVVHNGVDAELFTPSEAAPTTPQARRVISVGSYIARKDQRTLLAAWARLAAEQSDLHLVIVGQDGAERAALQAAAAALGLEGRLKCHTDLAPAAVAALLREATVSVQPSLEEPFGMALIEAGACGVPVIASAVGGHVEILESAGDAPLGTLFPAGDATACAQALREVLADLPAAGRRAQRFRDVVRRRYTWKTCADHYAEALLGARPSTMAEVPE